MPIITEIVDQAVGKGKANVGSAANYSDEAVLANDAINADVVQAATVGVVNVVEEVVSNVRRFSTRLQNQPLRKPFFIEEKPEVCVVNRRRTRQSVVVSVLAPVVVEAAPVVVSSSSDGVEEDGDLDFRRVTTHAVLISVRPPATNGEGAAASSNGVGDVGAVPISFRGPVASSGGDMENVAVGTKIGLEQEEETPGEVPFNAGDGVDEKAFLKIKETLRTYNKHHLQSVHEEELRCGGKPKVPVSPISVAQSPYKSEVVEIKGGKRKRKDPIGQAFSSKPKGSKEKGEKKTSQRPDLKALSKMNVSQAEKRIGHIPGVRVGYQFLSRAEMVSVGFHSHWLNGIDFIGKNQQGKYKDYPLPLAVSVVVSGMYEDDKDGAEEIVYTGQGGNNLLGNKSQIGHQELVRGNLALQNNLKYRVPVRVTRGHKCKNSYVGKIYTYDGLYKVYQHWMEKGLSGFVVHKYLLRRHLGQPPLTTNQVQFIRKNVKVATQISGVVCEDISNGQEAVPIFATNVVDDPPVAPTGFEYQKYMQVDDAIKVPKVVSGCKCKGPCDPTSCACAHLNGGDFAYVSKDGGRLIEAKGVVFECGRGCNCLPSCLNRTSQKGIKYRLEVFKTSDKGWAVRSWDNIPAGAPICEYRGVLMKTDNIDSLLGNSYIFDIDCEQTLKGQDGREKRVGGVIATSVHVDSTDESHPEFCIDACTVGNVARFINHSCSPNLFVQSVVSDHRDLKQARVVLIASDNISPLQELTYDYGYRKGSVVDSDGNVQTLVCNCGAACCKGYLY